MESLKIRCAKCEQELSISPDEFFCRFCGNPLFAINDEIILLKNKYLNNNIEIKRLKSNRWDILEKTGDWLRICGSVLVGGIIAGALGIFLGQWTIFVWGVL